ncbi:nitrilase-related carbon-nitrogen hydrolase [Thermogladius sp. 4427co]|uniref:nitrilase-related carbon-nitrogen hydrolase n=1 Tax=Thermogladius sp. 4427co TaxID=3450718 RepID=UPI003F7B30FD
MLDLGRELVVGFVQADLKSPDPLENATKIRRLVENNYKRADIIVTPEYSMANPFSLQDPSRLYEKSEVLDDSRFLDELEKTSSRLGAYILTHFIERTEYYPKTRSSSVIIDPKGGRRRVYSKIHLFDAYGYRESDFFIPGEKPSEQLDIKGVKAGVAICYDLRFPELFRIYSWRGDEIVLVHSGWVKGFLKEAQLDFLSRARAHENTVFIAVANQVGEMFTGGSGLYSPLGYKKLELGFRETYAEAEIDLEELSEAREIIPVVYQSKTIWDLKMRERKK